MNTLKRICSDGFSGIEQISESNKISQNESKDHVSLKKKFKIEHVFFALTQVNVSEKPLDFMEYSDFITSISDSIKSNDVVSFPVLIEQKIMSNFPSFQKYVNECKTKDKKELFSEMKKEFGEYVTFPDM